MRGLKQLRCTRVITTGHAFIQNIRRGHYELRAEEPVNLRVLAAFNQLVTAIWPTSINDPRRLRLHAMQQPRQQT